MDKITYFGSGDENVKENNWPDYCKSSNNGGFDEKDHQYSFADQFSWPPRHYTCTFCRRKFKSAQALGGHMNVHRRDRAMLRQPPPWALQFPNNNPNNPNSDSSPKNLGFIHSSVSSSSSSSASLSHLADNNNILALPPQPSYNNIHAKPKSLMMPPSYLATKHRFGSSGLKELGKEGDEFKAMKNGQNGSRLDLELGLVRNKDHEIDLELRLGCSTTY